jgi:hypothetical protein
MVMFYVPASGFASKPEGEWMPLVFFILWLFGMPAL